MQETSYFTKSFPKNLFSFVCAEGMKYFTLIALLFLSTYLALTAADDVPEEEVMELLVGIASMEPEELMEMQEGLQEVDLISTMKNKEHSTFKYIFSIVRLNLEY